MQETARKPYRLVTDSGAFIPADYNDLMRRSPVTAGNIMEKIIQTSEPLPVLSIPTPLLLRDGAVGLPALSWVFDKDTGRYRIGDGNVGESVDGTLRYDWNATRCKFQILVHHPDGTVTAPSVAFHTETGTGRYLVGVNNVGESLAGVAAFDWNSTRLYSATLKVYLGTGTPVTSADWVSVLKTVNGTIRYAINNDSTGASALSEYYSENDAGRTLSVGVRGSGWSGAPFNASDAYIAAGTGTDLQIYTPTGNDIYFLTGNTWRGTWSGMDGVLTLFYDVAFQVTSSGSFKSTFTLPSISAHRTVTIPDWSGTLLLTTGLSVDEGQIPFGIIGGGPVKSESDLYYDEVSSILVVGGDYWFKSATSFFGKFEHAITANRTWTFPDATGTVLVASGSAVANQITYWATSTTLAGDAGVTLDPTDNAITVTGYYRAGTSIRAVAAGDASFGSNSGLEMFWDASQNTLTTYNSANEKIFILAGSGTTESTFDIIQQSTGDPFMRFAVSTTQSYAFGIDNSASDALVISGAASGTAVLGTGDLLTITTGGQLRGVAGAVGTPTYSFTSDTDTGMLSGGAGELYLSADGAARLRINSGSVIVNQTASLAWGSSGIGSTDINMNRPAASVLGIRSTTTLHNQISCVAATETVFNETQADIDFRIEGDSISHLFFTDATATTENIAVFAAAAPNWQAMDRGLFIGDSTTAPTGNPASGGFLYSVTGAGTWRGSGGTTTTFAAAGPHCGACGYDFWKVCCVNETWGSELRECGWCGKVYKKGPASVLNKLTKEQRAEILN